VKRALAAMAAWVLLVSASSPLQVDDALILGDTLPSSLKAFNLLSGSYGRIPNGGVTSYRLNTPLFSDYAEKFRFFYVPKGKTIAWRDDDVLDFPVGSVLVKSFGYPADMRKPDDHVRILETRLLVRRETGWIALPYVWNADGTDAILKRAGLRVDLSWTHLDGKPRTISYAIPNVNQCKGCHDNGRNGLGLIGPKARNLNRDGQLQALYRAGKLDRLPADAPRLPVWNDPATGSVEMRARAYLDVNCGHCHNRSGPANTSGLWLNLEQAPDPNLGIGKRPTAAGRGSGNDDFAIDPGHPDRSIMIFRMQSLDPGIAMPELGRASVHEEGVALLSQWIVAMPMKDAVHP
jgi:uncharacterized repeat protein (TIGR03806 family)